MNLAPRPTDVIFVSCYADECGFYRSTASYLAAQGLSVLHVSLSRQAMLEGTSDTLWFKDARFYSEELANSDVYAEARRTIVARYTQEVLRALCDSDPAASVTPPEKMYERAVEYAIRWQGILALFPCRYLLPAAGPELFRRTGAMVSERVGVRLLYQYWAHLPQRLNIAPTEADLFEDMNVDAAVPASAIEDYLEDFRNHQKPFLPRRITTFGVKAVTIASCFRRVRGALRYERGKHEYLDVSQLLKSNYRRIVNYYANYGPFLFSDRKVRRIEAEVLDDRFVFFPLQKASDMAITVRAPHCRDQFALVKRIAASVPAGYCLCIKEHPHDLGGMPVSMMRELKRTTNIRILPPQISSFKLIQAAALVITINSTVGFEALIFGKPVITLARTFYNLPGLATHLADLAYLPQCIKRMLEMEVDKSALNHLVAAILDNSYLGLTYSGSHTLENAELCGKAIFAKILRLKQERDDIHRGTALICPTPADRDVIPSVG